MRDPLLHFILLGIAIFGLHWLWSEDAVTVQITTEMVSAAEEEFSSRVGHPPGDDERAQGDAHAQLRAAFAELRSDAVARRACD